MFDVVFWSSPLVWSHVLHTNRDIIRSCPQLSRCSLHSQVDSGILLTTRTVEEDRTHILGGKQQYNNRGFFLWCHWRMRYETTMPDSARGIPLLQGLKHPSLSMLESKWQWNTQNIFTSCLPPFDLEVMDVEDRNAHSSCFLLWENWGLILINMLLLQGWVILKMRRTQHFYR